MLPVAAAIGCAIQWEAYAMHRFTVTATYGHLSFSREVFARSYLAATRIAAETFALASTITVE